MLVKELQSLCLDVRVLDADGEESELSKLGEEDYDEPHYVSESDIGESVETDDMFDASIEKDEDGEDVFLDSDDFDDFSDDLDI